MIRKYLSLLLVIASASTLTASAATTTSTPAPGAKPATGTSAAPAISDNEAMRYLSASDLADFNDAVKKMKEGQQKIDDGTILKNRKDDPGSIIKLDTDATRKKGETMVKDGTAELKTAKLAHDKLLKVAIENRDQAHAQAAATGSSNYTTLAGQWPDVIEAMSVKVLGELWDKKYQHIYFAGVYAFDDPKYSPKPELGTQIYNQLRELDKDSKTLVSQPAGSFALGMESGKLVVSYPDRAADQKGSVKSAIIVGELLYESRSGYATFSLRAVDSSDMRILANEAMELSVEPGTAKLLGLPAYKVMAKRMIPVVAPKPATTGAKAKAKPAADLPPPALLVNVQDPNDFFGKAKQGSRVFRVTTAGHANTLENRFAILILKAYLANQQDGVAVSDYDFLAMALPAENSSIAATTPANINTAWVLPDLPDLNSSTIELDSLRARDLNRNTEAVVGKLSIQRDLPKLTLPTADDLRAAGYTASK